MRYIASNRRICKIVFTLYRDEFISGNPTSPADTGSVCVVDKRLSRYQVGTYLAREQFECKYIDVPSVLRKY